MLAIVYSCLTLSEMVKTWSNMQSIVASWMKFAYVFVVTCLNALEIGLNLLKLARKMV
jgi:hypothetical protein